MNEATNYRVVGLYRRTVSAVPALKRLIAVTDITDEAERQAIACVASAIVR